MPTAAAAPSRLRPTPTARFASRPLRNRSQKGKQDTMRQHLFKAVMAAGVLAGFVTLHPTEVFADASGTSGALRGVLKDQSNGDAAVGATVVATSPALQGEQVVITDEN